jgi:uncharacterized protein (TIGR02246 family)
MRKNLFVIVALALLTSPTRASATDFIGGTASDYRELQDIATRWIEAYVQGDLQAFMEMFHEDAVVMPHNVPTHRGTKEIRDFFSKRFGGAKTKFTDNLQEVHVNGNWAFVSGTFTLEIDVQGPDTEPLFHFGRYFVLYERSNDGWKILRDIDNLVPASKAGANRE